MRTLDLLPDMTRFRSDFSVRLVFQKVAYLVQEAGIPLGYDFGWYVSGPYSTSLADDGYEISRMKIGTEQKIRIDSNVAGKIAKLFKDINIADTKAPYQLELLASLLFEIRNAYPRVKNLEEAKDTLKRWKSKFADLDIDRAFWTLKDAGLVELPAAESP
jgi:uncharacterized protein YwgA